MIAPTRRTLIGIIPAALTLAALPRTTRPALAQDATPVASSAVPELFSSIPASILDGDDPATTIVSFSDLAAELAHTGTPLPESLADDDPDRSGLSSVMLATGGSSVPFQFAYVENWRDLHGFDIRDVDQAADFGVPPDGVTLLRGRFDRDVIDAALSDQGYETIDIDGVDVWNRGADHEVDLDHPISRYWIGQAQNVALLGDDTLVFAGGKALISSVIAAASGEVDTLADDARIVALFPDDQDPLIAATIVRGDATVADQQVEQRGSSPDDDTPLVPPVAAVLFGATPGNAVGIDSDVDPTTAVDYPLGESQIRVTFIEEEDAAAGAEVIADRLDNGQSAVTGDDWNDLFGEVQTAVDEELGTVVISLPESLPGQRRIATVLYQQDLGFLLSEEPSDRA
ncbi:MAG TPA: hypothetical protein VGT61_13970 [Thermomicrobiales bacterium]|nr:hypothetical protein [Thermomicrobiales bacterium]